MTVFNAQQAAALVADPTTSAQLLAQIAAEHREQWGAIALHPNASIQLVQWMRTQASAPAPSVSAIPPATPMSATPTAPSAPTAPDVHAAPTAPAAPATPATPPAPATPATPPAHTAPVVPAAPVAEVSMPAAHGWATSADSPWGTPAPEAAPVRTRKRRKAPWIIGSAAVAVAAVAALVLPLVLGGAGSGPSFKPVDVLRAFPGGVEYSISVLDTKAFERAVGTPAPVREGQAAMKAWLDQPGATYLREQVGAAIENEDRWRDALVSFAAGGTASGFMSNSDVTQMLLTTPPQAVFDEQFGPATDGRWTSGSSAFEVHDGITYVGPATESGFSKIPDAAPVFGESLATDELAVRMLERLQQAPGAYAYFLASGDFLNRARNVPALAGTINTLGGVVSWSGEYSTLTLVYNFDSAAAASDSFGVLQDAMWASIDTCGCVTSEGNMRVEGTMVIVDLQLAESDLGWAPMRLLTLAD